MGKKKPSCINILGKVYWDQDDKFTGIYTISMSLLQHTKKQL